MIFHSIRTKEDVYPQASKVKYELKMTRATQLPPWTQVNQQGVSNPKVTSTSHPPRDQIPLAQNNSNLKWNTCHKYSQLGHFAKDCPKRILVITKGVKLEKEPKEEGPNLVHLVSCLTYRFIFNGQKYI